MTEPEAEDLPSDFTFAAPGPLAKTTEDIAFTNAVTDDEAAGTGAITYVSGTPAVATVNAETGLVTIVGAGTTIISATKAASAGFTATTKTYTVNVTEPTPIARSLTFATLSNMQVGGSTQMVATTLTPTAGNLIVMTSNTTGVCTISSFVITALAAGTCSITATAAAGSGYAEATPITRTLTVTAATVVVAATPATVSLPNQPAITVAVPASLEVGKTATLTTTGGAATGTNNFLSNSPTICTVTGVGVVTAVAAGTCSVYAQRTASGFTTAVSADVTFKVLSSVEVQAIADAAVKAAADKAAVDAAAAAAKAAADKAEAEAKTAAAAARVEAVRVAGLNTVTRIATVKGRTTFALNLADRYFGYILELQLRTVVKGKARFTTIEYFAVERENGVVTVSTRAKIAKGQQLRIMSDGKVVRTLLR